MTNAVRTSAQGGVWTVTLDRPKANAIDVPTSKALYQAFESLQNDPTLRVGIITGTGRFFSAGWDLHAAASGETIDADHGRGGFAGLTEFFELGKPVIAAVNGLAIGGGFELALAADLIIACDSAEFALPELKLGMIPDSGGVLRLPRRLPRALATEMLFTGRRMTAQEASKWGLVNRITRAEDLLAQAQLLAQEIMQSAPLALSAAKQVLQELDGLPVLAAYAQLRSGRLASYNAMLASEDSKEGSRAFDEKRVPRWTGR
jgi:crotonobetainyl-CoA hydratase